jgi:hypothetical protein
LFSIIVFENNHKNKSRSKKNLNKKLNDFEKFSDLTQLTKLQTFKKRNENKETANTKFPRLKRTSLKICSLWVCVAGMT